MIRYKDTLMMAFAPLDKNGLAKFKSLEQYMNCLSYMWTQIKINSGDNNVCIPILGAGKTEIYDKNLSSQELLDLIIYSYIINNNKLKKPYKLIIYCKKSDDFSINKVRKDYK